MNDKFRLPEIVSTKRNNRKRRKKRGELVHGWEKLRERWPAPPVSIEGVGIISGDSSGIGAAVKESTPEAEFRKVTKRRRKRRGTVVMDGEEVATELLNPPPLPAGHTVTAFGGGIIPGITNGGDNPSAIVGKALPRIGRRLVNNAKITGDQNPMTRVDANNNGLIFDGTWREMPDPTPGDSVSGSMSVFNKFKKPASVAERQNNTPFTGVDNLVDEQAAQVSKFERWAKNKTWFEFHRQHFDWWTFPIDRGSAGYGFKYDISGEPLQQLKNNTNYIDSLKRATSLYMESMAWDLKKHDWIQNPDFDRGQDPTAHINQPRLFKIGRSLQIHGLDDEFTSVREMVQSLRQAGYRVGNEEFWDNPSRYNMRSSFIRGGGVSGAMAVGIRPKTFNGYDGGEQRDPRKELPFIAKWSKIDIAAKKYFEQRKKGAAAKPEVAITFDWQDESTRLEYIRQFERGKMPSVFAKYGNAEPRAKARVGLGETLNANLGLLRQLGLIWGTQGASHGAFYSPFGVFMTHSSSAKNKETADGEQIRDLLGLLDKNRNPSQYWDYFENWIRNPYTTMRDSRTGRDVGLRLYFNNDYDKMANEFERRIQELRSSIAEMHGREFIADSISTTTQESADYKSLKPHVIDNVLLQIDDKTVVDSLKSANSIKHAADMINDLLYGKRGIKDGINGPQLESLLKDKRPQVLADLLKNKPDFTNQSIYDTLTPTQLNDGREWMRVVHNEALMDGINPSSLDVEKLKSSLFKEDYYSQPIVSALHSEALQNAKPLYRRSGNDAISGAMSVASSHIKTVDAENTTAQPRRPKSFINHVTSTPSAYLSLPDATDDIDEAERTGKPISWLIPGQLHPELNDHYNSLVEEIANLGATDAISLEIPPHSFEFGLFVSEAEKQRQDKLASDFQNIKHRHALILQMALGSLGVKDRESNRQIAYGLVMRASVDAARANYLKQQFDDTNMTPDSLETLKESTEAVFDNIDFMAEERVNVTVPAPTLEKIFNDGRLKTQHETNTSQGALNPDLRSIQEVAMFSIHPKSKQRPIYGTVRRGTNEDSDELSTQYGAATIVLKDGVERRTTWTQADSLGHQTAASTLIPNKRTWDGLHNQTVHPKTKDAYFSSERRRKLQDMGLPTDYENWPFIEAQVHGGVTLEDISHIILDEDWYEQNPEMAPVHFGPDTNYKNWMQSPRWIQISQVAESLNIPIVMLRKGLSETDVLEEPE